MNCEGFILLPTRGVRLRSQKWQLFPNLPKSLRLCGHVVTLPCQQPATLCLPEDPPPLSIEPPGCRVRQNRTWLSAFKVAHVTAESRVWMESSRGQFGVHFLDGSEVKRWWRATRASQFLSSLDTRGLTKVRRQQVSLHLQLFLTRRGFIGYRWPNDDLCSSNRKRDVCWWISFHHKLTSSFYMDRRHDLTFKPIYSI